MQRVVTIADLPKMLKKTNGYSSKMIDKKKKTNMNEKKSKPWTVWLNSLTSKDASAFSVKLKKVQVKARQRIFQQGECDNRLIFIESGKLKLSYWDSLNKKNICFSELSSGEVCGAETFFSHSPHTGTLAAMEDSVIRCLYKEDFQKLLSQHPAIENNLKEFCEKYQKKIAFSDSEKLARREHHRYPVSLKGQIQLIDPGGKKSSRALPVIVSDISIGGVCCITKKLEVNEAANFYQSQVKIGISYQINSLPHDIEKLAKVVAVRFHPSGESTIHLQYKVHMTEKEVIKLVEQKNIYTY
jgi:CRP-like cAMP-binding protein